MPSTEFIQAKNAGRALIWTTTRGGRAVNATGLLVRNKSDKWDLCVEKILVWNNGNGEIVIQTPVDGTTALAGTTVNGVNLDRSEANTTLAEAKSDETGLSIGTVILRDYLTAGDRGVYDFGGSLIIPYGHSVGVDYIHAVESIATIIAYFKAA